MRDYWYENDWNNLFTLHIKHHAAAAGADGRQGLVN